MCMGIPMQVLELHPPRQALVHGRGETKTVDTALLDDLTVGEWVLVFIDGARAGSPAGHGGGRRAVRCALREVREGG